MRSLLVLVAFVALAALVRAQGTPPPPPAIDPKLAAVLKGWEGGMGAVKSMAVDLVRTRLDKTFGGTEVYEGKALFLRSDSATLPSRASLDLKLKGKPEVFERYIFTGTYLYEFRPSAKVIAVHELPPPKPGAVADDNIVSFIFGMKAEDVVKRYEMTLTPPPPKDEWYHYLKIVPRFAADKAEFSEAQLVLLRASSLPRRFWFRQPNGDEITWDFARVDPTAVIPVAAFAMPALPAGWKWERQKDLAPRVLRNTDGK